jgi:hypothetical protein
VLGKITLPLDMFERRLDHRPVHTRWFNLEKYGFGVLEADRRKELKFSSRIHLRVCLEGGYHVLDESTMYISDQRPTAKQLWKQPIGILEVGILSAQGLLPMKMKDGRGSTDAYCVAKYGQKWVRTRTILDAYNPKWNEQYTWEVYDPCTVITLGVFDNCHLGGGEKTTAGTAARDSRIGKVPLNHHLFQKLKLIEIDKFNHLTHILTGTYSAINTRSPSSIHTFLPPSCSSTTWSKENGRAPTSPSFHHPFSSQHGIYLWASLASKNALLASLHSESSRQFKIPSHEYCGSKAW